MVSGAESPKRSPLETTTHIAREFGKVTYNPRRDAELGHEEYTEQLAEACKYTVVGIQKGHTKKEWIMFPKGGGQWPRRWSQVVMVMVMVKNSAYTGPLPRYLCV